MLRRRPERHPFDYTRIFLTTPSMQPPDPLSSKPESATCRIPLSC